MYLFEAFLERFEKTVKNVLTRRWKTLRQFAKLSSNWGNLKARQCVHDDLDFEEMILRKKFDIAAADVWEKLQVMIPAEFKAHFSKIQIVIEDEPTPEVLEELAGSELAENPEELCGLYVGTPLTQASLTEPRAFPDRVYLFRTALMDEADYDGSRVGSRRLREEIAVTLLHEIGHFFGLEEDDLERLGFD